MTPNANMTNGVKKNVAVQTKRLESISEIQPKNEEHHNVVQARIKTA